MTRVARTLPPQNVRIDRYRTLIGFDAADRRPPASTQNSVIVSPALVPIVPFGSATQLAEL
jgi:hypothetical protein